MQPWRRQRAGPFTPFANLDVGQRFRFPASDDINTKIERYGWYERPDGTTRSVVGTTLVKPVAS